MLFGERMPPPISSTKSMIGHTLTAAGAIEAAICLLALRHQVLPPTINQDDVDTELGLDTMPRFAPAPVPRTRSPTPSASAARTSPSCWAQPIDGLTPESFQPLVYGPKGLSESSGKPWET
jgi:hypothetical protein